MKRNMVVFLLIAASTIFAAKVAVDMEGTGTTVTALEGWAGACKLDTLPLVNYTAGDTVYIMGAGAVAANVDMSGKDGTGPAPIVYIGVKAATTNWPPVPADYATDTTDAPHVDHGAYLITFGDYSRIMYYYGHGTRNSIFVTGVVPQLVNCVLKNTNAPVSTAVIGTIGASSVVDSCLFYSTGGGLTANTGAKFKSCYFKIKNTAVTAGGGYIRFLGCFFDTATCAFNTTADNNHSFDNNTFKKCDTVISATTDYGLCVTNNIVDSTCLYIYKWGTYTKSNYFSNNLIDSSATMVTWTNVDTFGLCRDFKKINADPLMFVGSDSLLPSSPALKAASW